MTDMAETIIPITEPDRVFKGHTDSVKAVAAFPNGGRMVTCSADKTLRLWDLKNGAMLKNMEGHRINVSAMALSKDGKLIASGDGNGELIVWDGDTGESLMITSAAISESYYAIVISSLDFSPDGAVLMSVSLDRTMNLWRTNTWGVRSQINVGEPIYRGRYSPSGKLLAIVTESYIQIWDPSKLECIAKIVCDLFSLAWTPDGTRLLSGGFENPTILEWDTSTWKQVGNRWRGHYGAINDLAVNSTGTLVVSASKDNHVHIWRISDRRTVAVFNLSHVVNCVTFSTDGKYILCGCGDNNITEWRIPEDAFLEVAPDAQTSSVSFSSFVVPLLPSHLAQEHLADEYCRGARDRWCEFLTVFDSRVRSDHASCRSYP